MTDEELLDLVRLNLVPGLGPRLQSLLLARFGSASAVLAATGPELLSVDQIGPKLSAAITKARSSPLAAEELQRCREAGVSILTRGGDDYPPMLTEIPDPPMVLYMRGMIEPTDELAVALVGSRQCTPYGRRQAQRLSGGLARAGLTVVSGLARGIDSVCHRAALTAGGRTIAVCATGLATTYPPEHAELAEDILDAGAVISESPLDRGPTPGIFPQRNRIISGISLGVVIVEANRKSGALHTARHAMEQGREVFAVPGPIDSPASQGCHDLIRDGAALVRSVDDILEELGPLRQAVRREDQTVIHQPRELNLDEQELAILNLVHREPRHIDEIVNAAAIETSRVLATITVLEMKRLVTRMPGGYLVRR
ncbi:MAG: DNA-processing protein DprA [Maioricimonas sp. JB049]